MDEIASDIIAIIEKNIAKKPPSETYNLRMTDRLEDLGIDSFGAIELIFELEERFDIAISYNTNDAGFETVGDVVTAIKKLINGKS